MKNIFAVALLSLVALVACGGPEIDPAASGLADPGADQAAVKRLPPPAPAPAPGAGPSIAALSIRGSPPAGGTKVLIAGSGLDPAAVVTFDGLVAQSTAVAGATNLPSALLVITPPHAAGYVDVQVTNPDGSSAVFARFRYAPPPTIASVAPAAVAPGDQFTISGASLDDVNGVQVQVGGAFAQVVSAGPDQIVAVAPRLGVAGAYAVVVARYDGQYAVAAGALTVSHR